MTPDPADRHRELLAALERGKSLPASWYTDQSILDLEFARIFSRTWQYVGPASELAKPGDFISGFAGIVPVVAVRNDDGLAAFVNVCRHRRHMVMKERGCAKVMQCPYHAWTYDFHGTLRGAPRTHDEPHFALEDYPLLPARAEALGPWVFVNLDHDAAPVAEAYKGVLEAIAGSGIDLDALELYRREDWESGANWKTMIENFLECYHCAVAHPGFAAAIDVRPAEYKLESFGNVLSQIGHKRESALEGRKKIELPDLGGGLVEAQYHLLWPNTTISINPGFPNLEIDVWIPTGPNTTRGLSEHYFGRGFDPAWAEQMIAFNAEVGAEDDELTRSVQIGLLSGLPQSGRFLTGAEHLAIDFLRLVVNGLAAR